MRAMERGGERREGGKGEAAREDDDAAAADDDTCKRAGTSEAKPALTLAATGSSPAQTW